MTTHQPAPDRCQAGNCIRAYRHTGPCLPPPPRLRNESDDETEENAR